MTRSVALAAAVVGAAGSLLSATALPWAHYGDITVPLTRFPGWGGYVAVFWRCTPASPGPYSVGPPDRRSPWQPPPR